MMTRRQLASARVALSVVLCLIAVGQGTLLERRAGATTADDIIQVPLRWCVVAGSTAEPNRNEVVLRRMERATAQIWLPAAHIILRSAMTSTVAAAASIPVIADPNPAGTPGDIDLSAGTELKDAKAACEQAWETLSTAAGATIPGPIALNVQHLLDPANPEGFSTSPWVFTSPTASDLCMNPHDAIFAYDAALVVEDASLTASTVADARIVAHEFGRVLNLKAGRGGEDGCSSPPDPLCASFAEPPSTDPTVMDKSSSTSTKNLTRWQCAVSRNIARVMWGAFAGQAPTQDLPTCSAWSATASASTSVTVMVNGGRASSPVAIDLDDSQIATATLDASGMAMASTSSSGGVSSGLHLITVHATSSTLAAECVVIV